MLVKELIQKLSELSPDATIVVDTTLEVLTIESIDAMNWDDSHYAIIRVESVPNKPISNDDEELI